MGFLSWIIIGSLAGWIASIIMGKDSEMGKIANLICGIVGGILGGEIMETFGNQGLMGFSFHSLWVATLGAVIVIFLWKKIRY